MAGAAIAAICPHRESEELKPMMNAREKSDFVIVAVKSSNKAGSRKEVLAAEMMEPRTGTKENAKQQSMRRAQNRESMTQALRRVRQIARFGVKHPR